MPHRCKLAPSWQVHEGGNWRAAGRADSPYRRGPLGRSQFLASRPAGGSRSALFLRFRRPKSSNRTRFVSSWNNPVNSEFPDFFFMWLRHFNFRFGTLIFRPIQSRILDLRNVSVGFPFPKCFNPGDRIQCCFFPTAWKYSDSVATSYGPYGSKCHGHVIKTYSFDFANDEHWVMRGLGERKR